MSTTDGEFDGLQLLLVEDNPTNQFAMSELLQAKGMIVTIAEDGQVAIDKLAEREDLQLVLMDVEMPVMDGITATREIRRRWPDRELPILALTATAEASDRLRCVEAGMNDILAKPIRRKAILTAIREWLLSDHEEVEAEEETGDTTFIFAEDLPDLPGIDIRDAIKRLGLPWEMIRKMLIHLSDTLPERQESMRRAMAGTDPDEIRRTAHSIAGAAGNAGALDLYRCSKNLEYAIRQNEGDAQSIYADLDLELTKVIASIRQLEESEAEDDTESADSDDLTRFQGVFETLAGYIDDGDCYAVDETIDAVIDLKVPAGLRNDFKQIRRHIDGFDFIAALECVERVRPRMK